MICESCNQNLATVHLTEIVQKHKKETHLCEACAQQKGLPGKDFVSAAKSQFSVKEFLGAIQGGPAKGQPAAEAALPAGLAEPCARCGLPFSEFKATGRLGCPGCYEHFRAGLVPLLEKIHGTTPQHVGRMPSNVGARVDREKLIAAFQRDLTLAVEREEYERAAELRDKIRALEQAEGTRTA